MNWDVIIPALIAGLPAMLAAIGSLIQATRAHTQAAETHMAVNSRMDDLLNITRRQATDAATLAEKRAEHVRKGEAAVLTSGVNTEQK